MIHIGYLPGRSVLGFWGLKEADYGCPDTPAPYDRVVPPSSGVFPCSHCKHQIDFANPRRREHYHDTRVVEVPLAGGRRAWVQRNNYWCPWCGWRFYLGKPDVVGRLEHYAMRGGVRARVGRIKKHYLRGLDVLRGRG